MPTYKPYLSRRQEAKYLSVAEALLSRGVDIDIPDEWRGNSRVLHIMFDGPSANAIYQLSTGQVVFVCRVAFAAERVVTLRDLRITPGWDSGVHGLSAHKGESYRCAPGLEFEYRDVLNHRIEKHLRLKRGDMHEGYLLGLGLTPVPDEYGTGRPAPVVLSFLDQFLQEHQASEEFIVERSTKKINAGIRPGSGVFEQTDRSRDEDFDREDPRWMPRAGPTVASASVPPPSTSKSESVLSRGANTSVSPHRRILARKAKAVISESDV